MDPFRNARTSAVQRYRRAGNLAPYNARRRLRSDAYHAMQGLVAAYGIAGLRYAYHKAISYTNPVRTVAVRNKSNNRNYNPAIKANKKKINKVNKKIRNNEGILTYRKRQYLTDTSLIGQSSQTQIVALDTTIVEEPLALLRVFDPSNPATLLTVDATAGTYHKQVLCKAYSKCCLRNNYQVPCKIAIYVCVPKKDTSILPRTAYSNGMTKVGITTANANPLVYLTDSPEFNDLWKISKTIKKTLKPGQEVKTSHVTKEFSYDPSLVDAHSLDYQREYQSHVYIIRVEGVTGHSSTASEVGQMEGGVDYFVDTTIRCTYDAGMDITYFITSNDTVTAWTTSGVVSQMEADNQVFSQA